MNAIFLIPLVWSAVIVIQFVLGVRAFNEERKSVSPQFGSMLLSAAAALVPLFTFGLILRCFVFGQSSPPAQFAAWWESLLVWNVFSIFGAIVAVARSPRKKTSAIVAWSGLGSAVCAMISTIMFVPDA